MGERRGTKALELWCRRLLADYDGVVIDNMTTSWRNGLAFCALIHRFRPDLIDFSSLKSENIYKNNELAFRTAETHLGIPALLDPEDMVDNEIPDRLSILTYLSQFYQRLGHTVTKSPINNNNDDGQPSLSPLSPSSPLIPSVMSTLKLSKGGYEVCTACGKPVYLAQRLIVSRKLFHRGCFRCGTCNTLLSPHSCFENGTDFICEACKNAEHMSPLEEDDRMGMVLFHDDEPDLKPVIASPIRTNRQSISDRIKLFESNTDELNKTQSTKNVQSWKYGDEIDGVESVKKNKLEVENTSLNITDEPELDMQLFEEVGDKIKKSVDTDVLSNISYKSNSEKLSFLQTQLSTESNAGSAISNVPTDMDDPLQMNPEVENKTMNTKDENSMEDEPRHSALDKILINSNVPDDVRLEEQLTKNCKISAPSQDKPNTSVDTDCLHNVTSVETSVEAPVVIPPRRRNGTPKKNNKVTTSAPTEIIAQSGVKKLNEYPEDLNPFSDDESEETTGNAETSAKISTNPFGSSDEDDSDIKIVPVKVPAPRTTVAPSLNPFWSDGEEPSTDDESRDSLKTSHMYDKTTIACSTPNLRANKPRRLKPRAPKPPALPLHGAPVIEIDNSCLDDVASLSSLSSHCSTINSETKPSFKLTPKSRKKRPAPTPPDNASLVSTSSGGGRLTSLLHAKQLFGDDYTDKSLDGSWRRVKGPAPGLPLPGRRVVRPALSPGELQSQLDLLETQQLGLERQGVLIEQMIREKCEGENASPAAPEVVEDLVIQLCELVNEKNDLFRKHAELMYIRRQQRLEQEQADIEHEIRIIQSRPAVNRIDADKAREEQLVCRLVDVVRLRDELVQQLERERRRERDEDEAIALSIAERRAKRNSDSNHSSLQSEEVVRVPKKSKVKDRVKKHIKKAKNTLNPKKKDSEGSSKETAGEKKEKTKWF